MYADEWKQTENPQNQMHLQHFDIFLSRSGLPDLDLATQKLFGVTQSSTFYSSTVWKLLPLLKKICHGMNV